MNELSRIKHRLEIGYTMAVYGTKHNRHGQMLDDIEALIRIVDKLKKE